MTINAMNAILIILAGILYYSLMMLMMMMRLMFMIPLNYDIPNIFS
jgi:hypothetical protein